VTADDGPGCLLTAERKLLGSGKASLWIYLSPVRLRYEPMVRSMVGS
jgi:hypothetical protein